MKVKLGSRDQLYGPQSDPAQAHGIQINVHNFLATVGLKLVGVYTGVKGPDVWFEVEDDYVEHLERSLKAWYMPAIGPIVRKTDEDMGEYIDIPLILEKRTRGSRR
jgi:hypothetical protein